jgi:hypothetical protein
MATVSGFNNKFDLNSPVQAYVFQQHRSLFQPCKPGDGFLRVLVNTELMARYLWEPGGPKSSCGMLDFVLLLEPARVSPHQLIHKRLNVSPHDLVDEPCRDCLSTSVPGQDANEPTKGALQNKHPFHSVRPRSFQRCRRRTISKRFGF